MDNWNDESAYGIDRRDHSWRDEYITAAVGVTRTKTKTPWIGVALPVEHKTSGYRDITKEALETDWYRSSMPGAPEPAWGWWEVHARRKRNPLLTTRVGASFWSGAYNPATGTRGGTAYQSEDELKKLRELWPGDFTLRRGKRSKGAPAPASVVDALLAAAATGTDMSVPELVALGRRKAKAHEENAKDLLELILTIADAVGIHRRSLLARTGYTKQQLSTIVGRNKQRIPEWTEADDMAVVALVAEHAPELKPVRVGPTHTVRASALPGGIGRIRKIGRRNALDNKEATVRKTRVNGRGFALVSAALPQPPTLERHDVTEVLSQLAAMRAQLDSLEHGQRQGFAKIAAMIRSRYPDDHEISVAVDRFIAEACR